MLQLWKNLINKNNQNENIMMDENKLISLMENFKGQKFQWIKTARPELLGKVVICRSIEPRGNQFVAIFDDGSTIDTNSLNTSLLMIHGDMTPLSREEVESISGTKRAPVAPQAPVQSISPVQPNINSIPNQTSAPIKAKPNMFELFNSEPTQLNLMLSVKLPEKKLLKMMYSSAENKEEFLSELSEYLLAMINKQVIQKSMAEQLAPLPAKKETKRPIVNLREIDDSN